jgi:GT2 family glycosyltransferase
VTDGPAPNSAATITVVIVMHDNADELSRTLPVLATQLRADDRVVVVDSGSSDAGRGAAVVRDALPDALLVDAGGNVGFAGGINIGAALADTDLLLLLNPDAVPCDGCVDALRAAAARHPGWAAWQALVALEDGKTVNTDGNLVHWLGFGWAGGLDRPIASIDHADHTVGFPSGAAMIVRRDAWTAVGGFESHYFMYGEDLDLGLRLRLAGYGLGIVPSAVVEHDYSFTKGDYKWFHLERNRWWTLLGAYPASLLVLAAPGLLAFELALLIFAWRGGWLRAKLRAQRAVLTELPAILRRRRRVQRTRTIGARAFAEGLTDSLDSPMLAAATVVPGLAAAQRAYWRTGLRLVR